jgi:hypothetical protein
MAAVTSPTIPRQVPQQQEKRAEKLRIAEVILLHQRSVNEEAGYIHEVKRIDRTLSRIRRKLAQLGFSVG